MGTTSTLDISEQFQKLMNDLDVMNDEVADKAVEVLQRSGEIIAREQRRLISGRSNKLPNLIKTSRVFVTKKGKAKISIGYDSQAIKENFEAVVMEFGRPRGKDIDKKGRKIGVVQPTPHIRQGFDNKKDEAIQTAIEGFEEVLKKW